MDLKLSKKSEDAWMDMEQTLLESVGLDSEQPATADAGPEQLDDAPPAPTPRSGTQPWGRWSHEGESVELELALPDGVRARDLSCEVSKPGLMRVLAKSQSQPLLSGQLALRVDRTELVWTVEEQDDGRRLLCIELPLYPQDPNDMQYVDCMFDESLRINGEPCLAPGLSGPRSLAVVL